jgi:hypothetical protein
LAAALIGLTRAPAQARHSSGEGTVVNHFSSATRRHLVTGRIAGSLPARGNQIVFLDRSSGRVAALHRRAFARSRRSTPFGFGGGFVGGEFGGFGGFIGTPDVVGIPRPVQEAAPPARSQLAADLPPCHEMTPAGVAIERGMSCSRVPR